MIDVKQYVVEQLSTTNIPVYYELFVNNSTPIPCITYFEASNSDAALGDTLQFGNSVINIKVWGKDVETLEANASLVDDVMKNIGFTRTTSYHSWLNELGHYFMRYEAITYKK